MKVFLRVAIASILVVAIGFGVYAWFFQPANKDAVFLALSQVSQFTENEENYKEKDTKTKLSELAEIDKFSNIYNDSKTLHSYIALGDGTVKEGLSINQILTHDKNDTTQFDSYSYADINVQLDNVFNGYFASSQAVTNKIAKADINKIKKSIKTYQTSHKTLFNNIDSVVSLQNFIKNNNTSSDSDNLAEELTNRYLRILYSYRENLLDYINLISEVENFVIKNVYGGEAIIDKSTTVDNIMLKAYKLAFETGFSTVDDIHKANDYLTSATKIATFALQSNKDAYLGSIFTAKDVVVKSGDVFVSDVLTYKTSEIVLYVSDDNKVYLDSQYTKIAPEIFTFSAGEQKILINNITKINVENRKATIVVYVDEDNVLRLFSGVGFNNQEGVEITTSIIKNNNSFKFSNSDVLYVLSDNGFKFFKIDDSYYGIKNGELYKYKNNSFDLDETQATGMTYYKNYYGSINKSDVTQQLSFREMVVRYDRIVDNYQSDFDTVMTFSTVEKVNFVKNSTSYTSIREASFDDLTYVFAALGFWN